MDIVNQLKEFRYYRRLDSNGTPIMLHPGICDDAADEIDRLREEYADLEFCLEQTREKLHGEIKRLLLGIESERDEREEVARDYHYRRRSWSIEAMPWLEELARYDHPQDAHQDEI